MKKSLAALVGVFAASSAFAQPGPQGQGADKSYDLGDIQMPPPGQGGPGMNGPQGGPGIPMNGPQGGPGGGPGMPPPMGKQDAELQALWAKQMKVQSDVNELQKKYGTAQGTDKTEIRNKIEKAVSDLFEIQLAMREHRIKRMEAQLEAAKAEVSRGRSKKEKYVAKRVDQLTGDGNDWEW